MYKLIFFPVILSLLLLASCNPKSAETNTRNTTPENATSDFTFKVLDLLNEEGDGNLLISPAGIYQVLMMLESATSGETQKEFSHLLSGSNSGSAYIKRLEESKVPEFYSDNIVFYDDERININTSFINEVERKYDAYVKELNFSSSSAVRAINDKVADNTNNRISKVLDGIESDESIFFINTMYLIADWNRAFNKELSRKKLFRNSDKSESEVDFMYSMNSYSIYKNDSVCFASLALADSTLSAHFVMPENEGLASYVKNMSVSKIQTFKKRAVSQRVILELPVFSLEAHYNLNKILQQLGIRKAYSSNADFSALTRSDKMELKRFIHDTYLKVDEGGIEGAAVTTASVGPTSMPRRYTFDKPFMVLVEDRSSNQILFAGLVQKL